MGARARGVSGRSAKGEGRMGRSAVCDVRGSGGGGVAVVVVVAHIVAAGLRVGPRE